MQVLKTPEEAFSFITDFPYPPRYINVTDTMGGEIVMAYYQAGPDDGLPVVLLHGEPTWAYLYRKMMPRLVDAGFNVFVPDLIGFGRSDKPVHQKDYTYARHLIWLKEWFQHTPGSLVTGVGLPVTIIVRAVCASTKRGSRWVPPAPGKIPKLTSGRPTLFDAKVIR